MHEDSLLRIRLSLKGRPLKSFTFDKEVITVGRSGDCDIVLDNSSISRTHLQFTRMPKGHYSVRDLDSSNGTYLNEERIRTALLYNNDVLRVGKFSLWISLERDGRAQLHATQRAPADSSQATMMLSTDEMDRLMAVSREKDLVPPAAGETPPGRVVPGSGPGEKRHSRIATLITMGIALILATSVGAAAAWFIIR